MKNRQREGIMREEIYEAGDKLNEFWFDYSQKEDI